MSDLLNPFRPTHDQPWTRGRAAHLLRRVGFAPSETQTQRAIDDAAFLPDGKRFLCVCDDGKIRLYSVDSVEVVREFKDHVGRASALAVDPDGSRFWSGGYDRKLREWDLETGTITANLGMHLAPITDMELSPDTRHIATASDDRMLRIFDLLAGGDGPEPTVLEGHYKGATALAYSRDGKTLYSGSRDETVRSWDIARGVQTSQSYVTSGATWGIQVSADDATVWTASESWREVPIWWPWCVLCCWGWWRIVGGSMGPVLPARPYY